jgi:hypothetical protein
MIHIDEIGYNELYVLPYYIKFTVSSTVLDEVWIWCCDHLRNWAQRPGHMTTTYIYDHRIFHFKDAKTRDWFILRWT